MATPIELIRQGLTEKSWQKVADGFQMMTGENFNLSEQSSIEAENETEGEAEDFGSSVIKTRTIKAGRNHGKNKFVDDVNVHPEDLEFMPKDPKKIKHTRRPETKLVDVTCKRCGKQEKVDRVLAARNIGENYTMRYLCNSCSCNPGEGG